MSCQGRTEAASVPADKDGSACLQECTSLSITLEAQSIQAISGTSVPHVQQKHQEITWKSPSSTQKGWEKVKSGAHHIHGAVPALRGSAGTPRAFLQL